MHQGMKHFVAIVICVLLGAAVRVAAPELRAERITLRDGSVLEHR